MKARIVFTISLLYCSTICFAQQDSLGFKKDTFELEELIQLSVNLDEEIGFRKTSKDSNRVIENKVLLHRISTNTPFRIVIKQSTVDSIKAKQIKIIQSPSTINKHEFSYDQFTERYSKNSHSLNEDEKLEFKILLDPYIESDGDSIIVQKIIELHIVSDEKKPNDSFIILSLIQSIAGTKPDFELFDFNAKFNLSERWFSMLSMDLSLRKSDSTNNSAAVEALLSVNSYFSKRTTAKNRKMFLGGGMKIFDSILLVGIHSGSLEISGPAYSSYFLIGPYYSIYNQIDTAATKLENKDIFLKPRLNIYSEVGLTLDSKTIDLLSNIRLKIGLLMPLGRFDEMGYQVRVVLEVPIGGILRF